MLSKLAIRRLTKLADFMDALPKEANEHFDMSAWITHSGKHDHGFKREIRPNDPWTCGTTACAAGWASTISSFRRAGFILQVSKTGQANWNLIERFFDLNSVDSDDIFGGYIKAKTPKQWAKNCRKYIKDNS